VRFDPFHDMDSIARQLLGASAGTARAPRFMPMDLFRAGDHYVLNADLPGIDPGSIEVSVDNSMLTIRAQRSLPSDNSVQWVTSERFAGRYMRQLSLSDGVDADRISATYENGVLSVTIPMAAKARPRKIAVDNLRERKSITTGGTTKAKTTTRRTTAAR